LLKIVLEFILDRTWLTTSYGIMTNQEGTNLIVLGRVERIRIFIYQNKNDLYQSWFSILKILSRIAETLYDNIYIFKK